MGGNSAAVKLNTFFKAAITSSGPELSELGVRLELTAGIKCGGGLEKIIKLVVGTAQASSICGQHSVKASFTFNNNRAKKLDFCVGTNSDSFCISDITCPAPRKKGQTCSLNSDCPSDGYCMSQNGLTTIGCTGICISKKNDGDCCSPSCAGDFLKGVDLTNAAHLLCKSGKCICDSCANVHGEHHNGAKCATDANCNSGLGLKCNSPTVGCSGTCGLEWLCGGWGKRAKGQKCSTNDNCVRKDCRNPNWWQSHTFDCSGTCRS